MPKQVSRRSFIAQSGKAALAAGVASTVLPAIAYGTIQSQIGFTQQPLPYTYSALEPYIDALTMEIHHSKHAATYTKNLADACIAEQFDAKNNSVITLLATISKYSAKMRNNGGGHFNHEFFWESMKAGSDNAPKQKTLAAIAKDFGSVEALKTQFADAAKNRFGSGWAWLVRTNDHKLVVSSTPNQDNPLMDIADVKGTPILGLDVWEHAYYLKYQNKRADYITNWWNVVNWEIVEKRIV
jgi:superoxide dismutase, Fe-Mn family